MSKQEEVNYLQIQTCVLKVNIHCDGCKKQVKKLLQRIDGVYTTSIDAEQGKVIITGNVDPSTLIKKLGKSGKHAEIWGSKPSNNQHQKLQNQNGKKSEKDGKGQKGQQQQPQQQQQMKGAVKDLKLPQFKDLKLPFKDQKSVKFKSPEYEDQSDDDEFYDEFYDDFDEEFDDGDDGFVDDRAELLKLMTNHGINGKKGGADLGVQSKGMGAISEGKNGNGGKKGGGNVNQSGGGGGGDPKNRGKKGSDGGNTKIATNVSGGHNNVNESKKGAKSDVGHDLNGMHVTNGSGLGGLNLGQMGDIPAVPGLPAMNAGGYFRQAGPAIPPGNPYYQQYAAAMMNHQRPIEIERFQPMENIRYTPATAYYAPPYPPPYNHPFADENPSGCTVM